MLISTSTDVYGNLGLVSSSLISSVLPYLYIIFGIVLAFWLTEILVEMLVYRGAFGSTADHFLKPRWRGYKWYRSEKWNEEQLSRDDLEN